MKREMPPPVRACGDKIVLNWGTPDHRRKRVEEITALIPQVQSANQGMAETAKKTA